MPGELVLKTLSVAWKVLHDRGVHSGVMGGLAVTHWGHARFTQDVDLLVGIAEDTAYSIVDSMTSKGFVARRNPLVSRVGTSSFIQLMYTPKGRYDEIPVDLLLADNDFLREAMTRLGSLRFGEKDCRVVSCEDMILLKLHADRIIDRMDVRYLLEYNRLTLDFAYLTRWITKLQLQKEWTEWWGQAFPDEPAPI